MQVSATLAHTVRDSGSERAAAVVLHKADRSVAGAPCGRAVQHDRSQARLLAGVHAAVCLLGQHRDCGGAEATRGVGSSQRGVWR